MGTKVLHGDDGNDTIVTGSESTHVTVKAGKGDDQIGRTVSWNATDNKFKYSKSYQQDGDGTIRRVAEGEELAGSVNKENGTELFHGEQGDDLIYGG